MKSDRLEVNWFNATILVLAIGIIFSIRFFSFLPVAIAAEKTFKPASGDWDDPNDWEPAGVPTEDDLVRIPEGGTVSITGPATKSVWQLYVLNGGSVIGDPGSAIDAKQYISIRGRVRITKLVSIEISIWETGVISGLPGGIIIIDASLVFIHGTVAQTRVAEPGKPGTDIQISARTQITFKGDSKVIGGDGGSVGGKNNKAERGGNVIISAPEVKYEKGYVVHGGRGGNGIMEASGGDGGNVTCTGYVSGSEDVSDLQGGAGGKGDPPGKNGKDGTATHNGQVIKKKCDTCHAPPGYNRSSLTILAIMLMTLGVLITTGGYLLFGTRKRSAT